MIKYRPLLLCLAAALIAGAGVVHGFWTNRWNTSKAVAELSRRMADVPLRHGDWVGHPVEFDQRELNQAGATGSLVRQYVNESTGDTVSVFLIAGLPSHISAHTPEVCYPAAGYTLGTTKPFRLTDGPSATTLKSAEATKTGPASTTQRLSILWAWDDGTGWKAPDDSRMAFVSRPALCKLYVVTNINRPIDKLEETPTADLLRQLLPVLHSELFGAEAKSNGPKPSRTVAQ